MPYIKEITNLGECKIEFPLGLKPFKKSTFVSSSLDLKYLSKLSLNATKLTKWEVVAVSNQSVTV
jgi:hypothetical protein